jgi:dephospho-CoA kinase
MLKIGLTGGIGTGKSTVTALFAALAVAIIDADVIAHHLVASGQPALQRLRQVFGDEIIHHDASLNRRYLRQLIFADKQKKQQLEEILHPLIYAEITAQAALLESPYCLISVPLLIETQQTAMVDRVLVIDCPLALQISRVQSRDSLSLADVEMILSSQASRAEKLAWADEVIDNSKDRLNLAEQVKKLHNFYLSLSLT